MPKPLRNPIVLGAMAIVAAVVAAIVVAVLLSEGEGETVVVVSPEETAAPASTPTRTPVPLEGMRAQALSTLTVRSGPGSGYISLGIVRRGAELEVVGRNEGDDWLEISYPPRSQLRGWVTADGVELEGSVAALPVATPESFVLPAVPTSPPGASASQQPSAEGTPQAPAPDLILSDAYVSQGQLIVTVTNQGTAEASPPIDVGIYGGDSSTQLRLARIGYALPAGASVELATQYDPATGPQRLLIRVDPANRVQEMNEGNNDVVFGVSGVPPSPSPTAETGQPTATPAKGTPATTPAQATPTRAPTKTPIAASATPVPTAGLGQ
jgi:hypothetical protein